MGKDGEAEQEKGQGMEPRGVISTKLYPPRNATGLVKRHRMISLVSSEGDLPRLITVVAPAGYGKSTVLCQWWDALKERSFPTGWVSLDQDDNDPVRFGTYILSALAPHVPDQNLTELIDSGFVGSWKILFEKIVSSLNTMKDGFAFFIDDLHVINEQEVIEALNWLLANGPENMTVFLAGRKQPEIATGKLKLSNQLLEVNAAQLSFEMEEADSFINGILSLDMMKDQVKALCDRTEGWIAGLQLATLALSDQSDRDKFVDDFSGSDRDITDYLGEVVLSQQPEEIRNFLLKTSVLDRMCDDLCTAVTGIDGAQELIERVEQRNLFLFPLDRERKWFRYHHLFIDFLRNRFISSDPDGAEKACLEACNWFEANDFPNEAVSCAFLAKDLDRAADLIAENALNIVQNRGEHATLLNWTKNLPVILINSHPEIRIGNAWASIFTRHYAEAESDLQFLLNHYKDEAARGERDDKSSIRCSVEMMECVLYAFTDATEQCRRKSLDWLEQWPEAILFNKGTVNNALGYACINTFEFDLGRRALADARLSFERCQGHYGVTWADTILGIICMRQGKLQEAIGTYERGLEYTKNNLGELSYAGSMLSLVYSETLYERNILDEAERRLESAFTLIHEHGSLEMALIGFSTLARLRFIQGRYDEAFEILSDGEHLGQYYNQPRLWLTLTGLRMCLLLKMGKIESARQIAESSGFFDRSSLLPEDNRDVSVEIPKLALIRLWLAEGEANKALPYIRTLLSRARKTGRQRKVIELLMLSAATAQQLDHEGEAFRHLDEALRLAEPEGFKRLILDEKVLLGDLLERMYEVRPSAAGQAESVVSNDYLIELIEGIGGKIAKEPETEALSENEEEPFEDVVESLTRREKQMLALIDQGLSNAELADTLFISEQTVKWHLHNAFGKLGVGNRTAALAKARKLNLL